MSAAVPLEIPSSNPDAEMAVLGSMLIDKGAAVGAQLILGKDDFYVESHRHIFEAIGKCLGESEDGAVDIVLVASKLRIEGKLGDCGGPQYLQSILNSVATYEHYEHYSRIVKKHSLERQITDQLRKTYEDKNSENVETLGRLIQDCEGLDTGHIFDLRKDLAGVIDELIAKPPPVIKTHFEELDFAILGFEAGDLVTIGTRTSGGKTATMTRLAVNMAQDRHEVLYITTEMSRNAMIRRLLPMATNIPLWQFRKGIHEKDKVARVMDACRDHLSELPIKIWSHPRPSFEDIRSAALRSKAKVVFVDYLQRCKYPKADIRTYEIQEFMVRMKSFATTTGIILVQGCQLDRQRDKNTKVPPTLADLKDSASVEAESTIVLLCWKPPEDKYRGGAVSDGCVGIEGIIGKARDGRAGGSVFFELNGELVKMAQRGEGRDPVFKGRTRPAPPPDEEWFS